MTQFTRLGRTGPAVFPIALGCMGMSPGVYGDGPIESDGIATIHPATERGVTRLDTSNFYGMGARKGARVRPHHRCSHSRTDRGALAALDKPRWSDEVTTLETLVPRDAIAGTRYPTPMMAHLDSEH